MLLSGLLGIASYWQYEEIAQDIHKIATENITIEMLDKEIGEAITRNDPKDARMYLEIGALFGFTLDEKKYLPRVEQLEKPLKTAKRKIGQFLNGFIKGKAETGPGVAGAITSDFTVVGDVRDLREQYKIHKQGEEINRLIVTLAGVGIGLTASSFVTLGASSAPKAGISTLKLAVKSKKITPSMQKVLLKQGSSAFNTKGFFVAVKGVKNPIKIKKVAVKFYSPTGMKKLRRTSKSMNHIRKSTSLADSVHLMKFVGNTKDLRRLEKISLKYGKKTKGLFKLLGKAVIGTIRTLKIGLELIVSFVIFLVFCLFSVISILSLFQKRQLEPK